MNQNAIHPASSDSPSQLGRAETGAAIHLAIIPDGNRRWAKERGLLPWEGHREAMENFRALIEWCRKNERIGTLTIWGFSTENWKRERKEVKILMELFEKYLRSEKEAFVKNDTRFVHSGRTDRIPSSLASTLQDITDATKGCTAFTVHFLLDHGGKDEIVRAVKKMQSIDEVNEESIRAHFDHPELPDMDLVLRTSGELRTSGFALWQSAYAEWIFTKKYFPALETQDLAEAMEEFNLRTRRFGGG